MLLLVVLAALGAAGLAVWTELDLPPPGLVLRHGFTLPPPAGPTGRRITAEGVEFIEVGTGCYRMGSTFAVRDGDPLRELKEAVLPPPRGPTRVTLGGWPHTAPRRVDHEVPVHWVEIRRPFWLAVTELTNAQFERFAPGRKRTWPRDADPVVHVTRAEALAYCDWLSKRSGLDVRLPSEAEWEYACRAGSATEYAFGDDQALLPGHASFFRNSREAAVPQVSLRHPNGWGFSDLHGNVWEWCADDWHEDYRGAPADGSAWMAPGPGRGVVRGGSWADGESECRCASRTDADPAEHSTKLGFRPAASDR